MSQNPEQKKRRVARVRAKIFGTPERPRLCVFRSSKHIQGQIVDDMVGKTLAVASDWEIAQTDRMKKTPTELANTVGRFLAERATQKGITRVVFDRRDKKYHGRVMAFAQGARKAGLVF